MTCARLKRRRSCLTWQTHTTPTSASVSSRSHCSHSWGQQSNLSWACFPRPFVWAWLDCPPVYPSDCRSLSASYQWSASLCESEPITIMWHSLNWSASSWAQWWRESAFWTSTRVSSAQWLACHDPKLASRSLTALHLLVSWASWIRARWPSGTSGSDFVLR